jgi:hypothetical protein
MLNAARLQASRQEVVDVGHRQRLGGSRRLLLGHVVAGQLAGLGELRRQRLLAGAWQLRRGDRDPERQLPAVQSVPQDGVEPLHAQQAVHLRAGQPHRLADLLRRVARVGELLDAAEVGREVLRAGGVSGELGDGGPALVAVDADRRDYPQVRQLGGAVPPVAVHHHVAGQAVGVGVVPDQDRLQHAYRRHRAPQCRVRLLLAGAADLSQRQAGRQARRPLGRQERGLRGRLVGHRMPPRALLPP